MLKRPRDAFDTPESSSPPLPASKRRYLSSIAGSSPSTSVSCLSTPYTLPYFRSPYSESIPHDSPSNPFGLNRALRALTIPRPTGFSKHIVLRLQLVSTADPAARPRKISVSDAPYRIVQVPLNYSFRLLHMLVLFLLASDARLRVRRRKRVGNHVLRSRAPSASHKPKDVADNLEDPPEAQDGHLFEVYENVRLYTNTYRPGVIKDGTGKLYARLSSTRERKLFPDGPVGRADNDVFGGASITQSDVGTMDSTADEDDEEEGWDWEPEDDFLLSSVWTDGPSLKKGIIYHHTPSTTVHITVNQARVPPRKGIGNAPYVFAAHGGTAGAVRIANIAPNIPPSSAPPSTSPAPQLQRIRKGKALQQNTPDGGSDSERDWDSSSGSDAPAPERPYTDDGDEVPDLGPYETADEAALERWNAHNAFERFLKREAARERAMRRPKPASSSAVAGPSRIARARMAEGDVPSSPIGARGGAHRYGHRRYVSGERDPDVDPDPDGAEAYIPPSSPSTLPIDIPSDCDALWTDTDGELPGAYSSEGGEDARENMRYMIELPLQTPFPAHPALRRRVRRASERMEQQVSKGLSEFDEDEPEDEDGRGSKQAKDGEAGAKAVVKGKENVVAKAHHKTGVRGREPDPEESPVKERVAARNAHPPPPAAQPESPSEENNDESETESDEGSVESVEVDGFTMGAPWLRMRGPKDGSSTGRGSQWDSDEEV
ncbi:hypothetical protein VTO73DRAFT_6707 [Trametes versicolor]